MPADLTHAARPSCTSPPTSAKMRAARASGSRIHASHVWITAHGRPAASSSASHSSACSCDRAVKRDTAPSWPHLGHLSRRLLEKLGFEQLRHLRGGAGGLATRCSGDAAEMQRRCSRAQAEVSVRGRAGWREAEADRQREVAVVERGGGGVVRVSVDDAEGGHVVGKAKVRTVACSQTQL